MESSSSVESLVSRKLKQQRKLKWVLGGLAVLVMVAFVVATVVVVIQYYVNENKETESTNQEARNSGMDLLAYFNEANNDGVKIRFEQQTSTLDLLQQAIKGPSDVIEVDIQSDVPCAGAACTSGDVIFSTWLQACLVDNGENTKALKINVKLANVLQQTLTKLQEFSNHVKQPVLLNFDVGDPEETMDMINTIFPNLTLVPTLSLTSSPWDDVDRMFDVFQSASQNVMFSIRAHDIKNNWDKLGWLLDQNNKFSFYVEKGADDVTMDELFYVRDNTEVSRVYYSDYVGMNEPIMKAEAESSSTDRIVDFYSGGDPLDFYRMTDAIDITWAHRVNSRDELEASLSDPAIKMIEADIKMFNNTPVMSHDPPVSNYELTLEEWLNSITSCNYSTCPKGAKLDYKSTEAVEHGMPLVSAIADKLNFPVWVNADVLMGPNSNIFMIPVDAKLFFEYVDSNYPDVTLSPGWKTAYNPVGDSNYYTMEMMEEMNSFTQLLRQPITFPARASLTHQSIDKFQWLLAQSNRYTITVWHSTSEDVTTDKLLKIYNGFPKDKVYFDIPDAMMADLKQAIKEQS